MALAALVASALGVSDLDLGAIDAGAPVGQSSVSAPDDDAEASSWTFDPARCDTGREVDTPVPRRWIRHKVAPRETIAEIAFRHGVEPWEVRGWNGLGDDVERVRRGLRLRIRAARIPPARAEVEYTIAQGDSWASIARAHGVTPSDLRSYNWPYRGKMKPGNVLTVFADPIVRDWVAATPSAGERVRRGAVGIGAPDMGVLLAGVQIPEGEGYRLRMPQTSYGTSYAVSELLRGLDDFRTRTPWQGQLALGSMSGPHGGPVGHHKSHQTGRDIDIRLPRREGVSRYADLRARRVDWAAAWAFVQAFAALDTQVIFLDYKRQKHLYRAAQAAGAEDDELTSLLQYPRGAYARRGLVRHYPGHDKHFHVRFSCGPCEVACASASFAESANPNAPSDAP